MSEVMRWWLNNPREWNAHPSTVLWGFATMGIVTILLGIVFWIRASGLRRDRLKVRNAACARYFPTHRC